MPGSAVGLQTVLGIKEEVTYGTAVTPDAFFEILSESLERRNKTLMSNGLRGGTRNLRRGSRRVQSGHDGGGTVTMEVPTTTFGPWLKHLLGAVTGTTYSMGSLLGKGLTIQKQVRDAAGVEVESFTFKGCKILSGEFSISVDQILQAAFEIDAQDVVTATAAAAASYSNVSLYHFGQATLNVDGSPVANVLDATVRVENPLNTDRYYLGALGLKKEPIDNDFPSVTGTLTAEFDSPATFYDRFAADAAAELVLEFNGDAAEVMTITVPDVRFTGGTPTVSGPEVIATSVPFEGQYDGTNPGITIEYA